VTSRTTSPTNEVTGASDFAGALRDGLRRLGHVLVESGDLDAVVVVHEASGPPLPIEEVTDEAFEAAWEIPMRTTVDRFIGARARGARRFVVVTSTAGMTGAALGAPDAMTAEALRAFTKSVARQWGPEGRTVNVVAVDPSVIGGAPDAVSLAPRALGQPGTPQWDVAPLVAFCCSDESHHLTGSTLMADGGAWMP
jgi:NAD(P)-dependent dehydrogenase (short-subunit alcohol dehydrogenase family)